MDASSFNLPGSYMVLEVTNRCPLKCGHCAVAEADLGHPHYGTIEHMSVGMVRELLEDLRASGLKFDNLVLFWLGEPLSNPRFKDIYKLVLQYSGNREIFGKIEVHTNTFPLSEEIARGALNDAEVPQVWHLTMDAIKAETFHVIKGLDAFKKSQRQSLKMVQLKGATNSRWPKLAMQFIVSDVNAAEAEEFVDFWKGAYADAGLPIEVTGFHVPVEGPENYIYLKSLDCPTPEEQDRQNRVYANLMGRLGLNSPVDPDAERRVTDAIPRKLLTPCSGFFMTPTISSDGRITMCTRDNTYHLVVGTLKEASFSTIWMESPVLNRRRQRVGGGNYDELPYCQTCFIPHSVNYSPIPQDAIDRFLSANGLDGELVEAVEGSVPSARPYPDPWVGKQNDQVYEDRTGTRVVQIGEARP
ncbi:MAG: radical SAM protein [Proteobacteria bacterium]|nr:radical SAM protein [Pseudomonadota bacterium]